jgi:minor histocompatibility antigen H13
VRSLQLTRFKEIVQLLAFFFVYDFAGVFASSVIIKVAQELPVHLPLKLVVPRLNQDGYSVIGLGDLIVPGILCSFCLRIEYIRAYRKQTNFTPTKTLPKCWSDSLYRVALTSYIVGLLSA